MNLNAYDILEPSFTEGTWVDPALERLYSTKIKYRTFYTFLKRYDTTIQSNVYYLMLTEDRVPKAKFYPVEKNNNIVKIYLKPIWDATALSSIKEKSYISVELIDKDENGEIYRLDI